MIGDAIDDPLKQLMERFDNPVLRVIELHARPIAGVVRAGIAARGDPVKFQFLLSQVAIDNAGLPFEAAGLLVKPALKRFGELQKERIKSIEDWRTL